jgi:hypothetical protein
MSPRFGIIAPSAADALGNKLCRGVGRSMYDERRVPRDQALLCCRNVPAARHISRAVCVRRSTFVILLSGFINPSAPAHVRLNIGQSQRSRSSFVWLSSAKLRCGGHCPCWGLGKFGGWLRGVQDKLHRLHTAAYVSSFCARIADASYRNPSSVQVVSLSWVLEASLVDACVGV